MSYKYMSWLRGSSTTWESKIQRILSYVIPFSRAMENKHCICVYAYDYVYDYMSMYVEKYGYWLIGRVGLVDSSQPPFRGGGRR